MHVIVKIQQLNDPHKILHVISHYIRLEHEYDEYDEYDDDDDHDQAAGELLSRLKTENPDKELFLLATACEVDLDLFTR